MSARVVIVGGGIGGLVSALCLHARGIHSQIFEQSAEFRSLGVGINLLPHAVSVLHELGLEQALAQTGIRTSELRYYNKLGQLIWSEPRGVAAGYPVPQYSIHRGTLHTILYRAVLERLGPEAVQHDHCFQAGFAAGGQVHARFSRAASGQPLGQTQEVRAAALIGADGIHSKVRQHFLRDDTPPRFAGRLLWRAVSLGAPFLDGRTMIMAGHQDQKFVCYPIGALDGGAQGGQAVLNWVAELAVEDAALSVQDWNRRVDRAKFAEQFRAWRFPWLDVPALIAGAEQVFEFPLADRDPLPQWTSGCMTLLGDAAHAMYPIGSNGASQAILDAQALAAAWSPADVAEGLQAYETQRRPPTTALVLANRRNGPEQVMQLAEERAPHGFADIHDVIPLSELEEIAARYKRTAGFSIAQVQRQTTRA